MLGDDTLQDVLKIVLHLAHCWGHQVSELVVKVSLSIDLSADVDGLDEVVGVGLGAIISIHHCVVVDSLVLRHHSLHEVSALLVHLTEVGCILTSKSVSERKSFLKLDLCKHHHTDGFAAAFAFLISKFALSFTEIVPGHSVVVLGVVAEHVSEVTILKSSKLRVDLVVLKCPLEVNGDLGADLGQNTLLHFVVAGFAEEKVLSLSEAQVRAHAQGLLREVNSGLTGG